MDTKNAIYYYKTFISQAAEKVDLRRALEGLEAPKIITMASGFEVTDRSLDRVLANLRFRVLLYSFGRHKKLYKTTTCDKRSADVFPRDDRIVRQHNVPTLSNDVALFRANHRIRVTRLCYFGGESEAHFRTLSDSEL
ncbi:MAG: hypothetical protein HRT77_03995 [Halioglobus sp.]|nr:hypothetical protein [Halioglobus sp.]